MPESGPQKPIFSVQKRTRKGCQTCKKRRKRCDEQRPTCGGCVKLNLHCAYGLNVRWGSTRESFITASMPQTGLGVGTKDELYELLQSIYTAPKLHRLIDSTLDGEGRTVLLKFLTHGYKLLASDFMMDDTWLSTHFPMCESSKACLLSILAFQAATDPDFEDSFDRYYDQALTQFTKETCGLNEMPATSIFFAGLFMCTISLSRLMPFTTHLNAIIALLSSWNDLSAPPCTDAKMLDFLSLLGFLDLQSHILNRVTPQNYVWYTFCRGQAGVNRVSGLPYSLMDLLAGIHAPGAAHALMGWSPPGGAPAQLLLWKATRFAGILSVYEFEASRRSGVGGSAGSSSASTPSGSLPSALVNPAVPDASAEALPTPQVLVQNILPLIQQCLAFVPESAGSFKQTLIYPLVMAASQRAVLTASEKSFICDTIKGLASERNHFAYQGILGVIREFWASGDRCLEDTAKRLDVEIALL